MTTQTTHLGLIAATTADNFRTVDLAANWQTIDKYVGAFVCTSSTRPTTWGANQTGVPIYEIDTGLLWIWNGTVFARYNGKGQLGSSQRTADLSTTATAPTTVVSAAVTIPAGNRTIMIQVSCPSCQSTVGKTNLTVLRDATQITAYSNLATQGAAANQQPTPAGITAFDSSVTAGAHTYYFQFATDINFGGTSTVHATANSPVVITVVEI